MIEAMMEDATPPWLLEVAGNLLHICRYSAKDCRAEGFEAALVKALSEAYEQGLEDDLRASRPDA